MRHCVALGCPNTKGGVKTPKNVTFHMFPKDDSLRDKWIRAIGRKDWEPCTYNLVCSEHFRDEDFDRSSTFRVSLKRGSVPSVFNTLPEHSSSSFLSETKEEPLEDVDNFTPDKDLLPLEPNFTFVEVEKEEITSDDETNQSIVNKNYVDDEHTPLVTVDGFINDESTSSENHNENENNLITEIKKEDQESEEFQESEQLREFENNSLKIRKNSLTELTNNVDDGESGNSSSSCIERFKCYYCGIEYQNEVLLRIHITTHFVKSSYVCEICGKSYSKPGPLNTHLGIHSDNHPFSCDICKKVFTTFQNFKSHTRVHRKNEYKCKICSRTLFDASSLRRHMVIHQREKKPFECGECYKSFSVRSYLNRHVLLHADKRYKCDLCNGSFIEKRDLNRHLQGVHGKKLNRYNCCYCDKDFENLTELNAHTLLHSND